MRCWSITLSRCWTASDRGRSHRRPSPLHLSFGRRRRKEEEDMMGIWTRSLCRAANPRLVLHHPPLDSSLLPADLHPCPRPHLFPLCFLFPSPLLHVSFLFPSLSPTFTHAPESRPSLPLPLILPIARLFIPLLPPLLIRFRRHPPFHSSSHSASRSVKSAPTDPQEKTSKSNRPKRKTSTPCFESIPYSSSSKKHTRDLATYEHVRVRRPHPVREERKEKSG